MPVSFIVVYKYGALQSDFFTNMDNATSWEAYVIKIAFMIVIGCHIPFMFFCAKESFLCMIDEAIRKSTSKSMETQTYNKMSTQFSLSRRGDSEEHHNKNTYFIFTMNPWLYYCGTIFIYIVCVILGIFINNLGTVFNLLSSLGLSSLACVWPGMFYLIAESRYAEDYMRRKNRINRIHAWI